MRLNTRGKFAISAMIDLAMRPTAAPVPLSELAHRHHVSLSYLEQVFAKLRQHQLVESIRGPGGGYTLGIRGDAISVADIISAIEDDDSQRGLLREAGGQVIPDMTLDLWDSIESALLAHMKTISLRSLADQQIAKGPRLEDQSPVTVGDIPAVKSQARTPDTPGTVLAPGSAWPSKY